MGQFALPAILLGVGVVGYWLLGPKKSATQKPDRMPSMNTSIRGSTVFVTFGSNRVSAQTPWTKNFKATRQKGGGKGAAKGGGSGGFGAAKGATSASGGYDYSWDIIFHYGIMDQPSMIRQGWIGGDNINDDDISTLTSGGNADVKQLLPAEQKDPDAQVARLTFTEAHFAPGYNTGDTNLESWDYFEAQEGYPLAYPSTAWVGFKQLDLGQSPSVPQLAFEFVPIGGGGFVSDPSQFGVIHASDTATDETWDGIASNATFMQANDKHYIYLSNTGERVFYCPEDGTQFGKTNDEWVADGTAAGFDMTGYPTGGRVGVAPVAGTPYFVMWGAKSLSLNRAIIMLIYKIENGVASVVATVTGETDGIAYIPLDPQGTYYDSALGHLIVTSAWAGDGLGVSVWSNGTWPIGAWIEAGATTGIHFGTDTFNDIFDISTTGTNPNPFNGLRPIATDASSFYVYYPADFTLDTDNTIDTDVQAFGSLPRFVKVTNDPDDFNHPVVTDCSGFFDLTDAGKKFDGTAGTSADDYSTPNAQIVNGHITLAFVRNYSDVTGKVRVQIYDVDNGSKSNDFTEQLFDPTAVGMGSFVGGDWVQMGYDSSAQAINYAWYSGGVSTSSGYVFGQSATFTTVDVTPAYIIKRILTSEVFGFATQTLFGFTISEASIDATTYQIAHQYCQDQGILISVTYSNQDNLLTILNELLALFNGYLVDDGTGLIKFGLVKGDGLNIDGSAPRVIDNSHFVVDKGKPPVNVTKAALEDGYNKIQFNYLDRQIAYNQNQVEVSDEVDIDFNGPRVKTFQPTYVMAGSVATQIVTRLLWQNLYGKDQYDFDIGWKDCDLQPGDLVTLVDSFDTTLSGGVGARIIKKKMKSRGRWTINAVRDYPLFQSASGAFTNVTTINPGQGSLIEPTQPMLHQSAYELPQEFQGSKAQVYFGYMQASQIMGAQLYLSTDGGASFPLVQDVQPFVIAGAINQPLPSRPKMFVEDGLDFYIFPASGFSTSTPTFTNCYDLDDITPAVRAAGGGVFIVGSEAVAMQDLTLIGQNHYRAGRAFRGWGGTPISNHNSGEWFHQHAAGIFAVEITQDKIGTSWQYKIAPYNFAGQVQDISSIDAGSFTVKGLYWLPRMQPVTQLYVASAQAWSANTPFKGSFISVFSGDGVNPAGSDIALKWPAASNTDGFGAGGYGAGGFGHWDTDAGISLPSYRVDVASSNGHKVSSFVVYTGYFNYTLLQNSADFGGVGRDLIFTVTPFNTKGDGPVADVRSLSMMW